MSDNLDLPGEYEDNRENILNEFVKNLKDDPKTILYDEDEWIEIADYALDLDNRFLFAEAVIWGLAAYPSSKGLRDREAIFLSEIVGLDDGAQAFKILASRPHASRIAKLLNYEVRNSGTEPHSFYSGIKKLLFPGEPLADHEVIEAVRILTDEAALSFILKDMALWEKSVAYTQTLWYEIAANALDGGEFETGLAVIDKLLAQHPYNADYWLLKGRLAIGAMNNSETEEQYIKLNHSASEAIDTVLAIRPGDQDAKQLLSFTGQVSIHSTDNDAPFSEQTIRLFNEAVDTENKTAVKNLCRQIPTSWFNINLNFFSYMSLSDINDERSNEIIDSWIEYNLTKINTKDLNLAPLSAEKSALVSIAEIFMIFNDYESFNELFQKVEKCSKTLKLANPLDLQYAVMCLKEDDKKNFKNVYLRLKKNRESADLNVSLLTVLQDIDSGKKNMAFDADFHLKKQMMHDLEHVIYLKGAIGLQSLSPSLISYLTRRLINSRFDT
ncbi:MAG: hypothetical protein K2K84_07175 [Muribaculaceae bacterium]|nr:hypothetical protein [Muribaculaceae bacterium]